MVKIIVVSKKNAICILSAWLNFNNRLYIPKIVISSKKNW